MSNPWAADQELEVGDVLALTESGVAKIAMRLAEPRDSAHAMLEDFDDPLAKKAGLMVISVALRVSLTPQLKARLKAILPRIRIFVSPDRLLLEGTSLALALLMGLLSLLVEKALDKTTGYSGRVSRNWDARG